MSGVKVRSLVLLLLVPVCLVAAPGAAGDEPLPEAGDREIADRVDAYLTRLVSHGFRGGVFVSREGRALLKKAYGAADEAGTPLTTDALMTTGSLTKQFTGALIALLEQRGYLEIDDSIAEHLPGVPDDRRAITIRHLLTHTAGLPGAVGHDWDLKATRDWVFDQAMKVELHSPPGRRRSYSNVGYALLAMIVEETLGMSYEEALQDELFFPLEMERTGMVLADHDGALVATGYRGGAVAPTFVDQPMLEDGPSWNLRGNGGVLSTIEDMYRWSRALDGHEDLLPEEVRDSIDAPLIGDYSDGYGYGWGHARSPVAGHMVEHDGGNGVFNADMHRYVDEGVTLFLMTSVSEWKAEDIIEAVESIVFGQPVALPPQVAPQPADRLAGLAGRYRLDGGEEIAVEVAGDGLRLVADGPRGRSLVAGGDGSFDPEQASREQSALRWTRAWAEGDLGPLIEALGGNIPRERLEEFPGSLRDEVDRIGALQVIAVAPQREPGRMVWVGLVHQRGSWYAGYRFRGEELGGLDMRERMPPGASGDLFLPVAEERFESFGLAAPATVRIRFEDGELVFPCDPAVRASR